MTPGGAETCFRPWSEEPPEYTSSLMAVLAMTEKRGRNVSP